ncbi:16S rRNA (guanine(966)-N(2))-methyltransferase RsmD [Agromyces atrinae]|uniref:16S rRNA (guanine(966)-N(2))-methyltransferase RsmD n=1 Tax=Agromyces atrinae TaxID=592376 RepID=UPI001F5A55A8|nr:16S rRNA (guanine(966)-N(2))-methyltransferase RsmD [Agromyces atrinae]MCI2959059.1 16S rRNA (guanine(966)-N(2))-methyltransferase RsmD [Agromyces atrinae]
MTRLIAGFAGSQTLAVPRTGTRPTSDRVREAVYSALEARDAVDDARILDLYAGSGALGLEAASRGARLVTLVEKNGDAAAVCRRNAEAVIRAAPKNARPQIGVTTQPVQSFLDASRAEFDVVFLDPPYDLGETELEHNLAALAPRLAEDAIVIVERSSRSPEPRWPAGIELDRRRNYGETVLWWAQPAEPSQPE